MNKFNGLMTSLSPHWATPKWLYEELDKEFHFDFDPCPLNNPSNIDGLTTKWGQRNFVNPPYGSILPKFIEKGFNEAKKGKLCVFLIPARTDTLIWHRYILPFSCPTNINKDTCWVAGIVDGEGCISIQKKNISEGMVNPSYGLRLAVKMTHKPTIYRLQEIFKCGDIYEDHSSIKLAYKWEVRREEAYQILRKIYPFSLTKKKEIFLAIDFYSGFVGSYGRKKTIPAQVLRSEEYYWLLRNAKKEDSKIEPFITEIRFIKGRLKFGESKNSAPFPSCVVIFRGKQ